MLRWLSPAIRALIVKELLSILRDPKSRMLLIGPPIAQLLIFSFAATLDLNHADIAVYNRDSGAWSRDWVERVGAASFVHQLYPVHSEVAMRDLIARKKVMAGLEIAETASRDVAAGRTASVQVVLDGRRANANQILLAYLSNINANLNAQLYAGTASIDDLAPVRNWFNPNLIYQWFVVPGIGGILVTFITLLLTALSIAREREMGTFDQLLVSPCTPGEIIIAKMVPALLVGMVLGIVMSVIAMLLFRVPFTGSFGWLVFSMFLYVLSVNGIGLMLSAVCNTQQQAILGTFTLVVPSVLMSGFATPVENMPAFLQWVSQGIPLKYYLLILQGSFLKDLPWYVIWANDWPLMIIATVTLTAAVWFVRGRLQ